MGHGNIQFINAFEKHAVAGSDLQSDPAIGVSTVGIPCQCDLVFPGFLCGIFHAATHQQAGFQDRLKAIADSEHQFVGLQKFTHGFIELTAKLTRKNDSRAQVVSVTEPARHAQNLVLAQQIRIFQQAEQVDSVGRRTRQFKRVSGLGITIGPWGSQNTNSRRCHVRLH